ncbi:hypothetical protein RND81_06G096400 [Saponaria officinalis]|uniref:MADS-box domain-containing protein n=1 Tax=Saponaria officinalis TaxID=3572 RepID=A0AAW1K4L4_SAPOF
MTRNPSIGRRRTVLKKIENKDDRLITFSKRRSGIYKKASEMTTLCDAEIGILVFSESGKPYTYGAPDFETISNRFRGANNPPPAATNDPIANIMHAFKQEKSREINNVHDDLCARLDILKKEGDEISKTIETIKSQLWWEAPLEDLSQQEINQLTQLMEQINIKANEREEELSLIYR